MRSFLGIGKGATFSEKREHYIHVFSVSCCPGFSRFLVLLTGLMKCLSELLHGVIYL